LASFAHLHLHTEYSLLDGLGRIRDYMDTAERFGMRHVAITDHGVMYGVLDWYKEARARSLVPVIGVEGYMARSTIADREDRRPYHIVLLAENLVGYRNLLKLVSRASIDGFYYKPRFDIEMLQQHSEGIICTSACIAGPLSTHLLAGDEAQARRMAGQLLDIFGRERFYIELQDHGLLEQRQVIPQLARIAKDFDVDLVAANDVHYLRPEDAAIQELLICIQTNRTVNDPKRMKMSTDQLYFKSPEEMAHLFSEFPDAVTNTVKVAERCDLQLEFGRLHLPNPDIPPGSTAQEHLAQLCWQGLEQRYPEPTDEIRKRLDYELHVIAETGFPSYMLIVRDFANFARERGIPFGVRGSAAASIVLYTLGITDIDPMANRLVFERFLNLERREMPDIDMDFADNRRAEVIEYVANKYGHDHVAQIITFGTMGAKAAVRDVGRALGWAVSDVDRVARLIPAVLNMTLDRALEESGEFREAYESEEQTRALVDQAKRLEGIARHAGTHAAGVVISSSPLVEHLPLQRPARVADSDPNPLPTTQFPMETVAEIGLLKMDFLGLSNLTILGEAVAIIQATRGISVDTKSLPDGDPPTYAMLGKGETFGVFQLESAGMRRAIQELRPQTVAELAAMVALYRPGPMQHIPRYCRSKHGQEPIRYPHQDLADVLDETYGVIVYQDQVLLIAQRFAGYTLGEADIMRKAMGKKIAEKMKAERERFIAGAADHGYTKKDAELVFDLIEPFAGYAFNKAHAVCYGTISYQTAYLKANFPAEYMTAVLRLAPSHPSGPAARVAAAVAECQKLGITVLPPDINRSGVQFEVEQQSDGSHAIRFGLAIIKNAGEAAVEAIVTARDGQPEKRFGSLLDLCLSVDGKQLNRRVLESLIRCGACDGLGERSQLLASLDRVLSAAQAQQRAVQRGQMGLFAGTVDVPVSVEIGDLDIEPVSKKTLLAWEKEHLGVYVTENPLTEMQSRARGEGMSFISTTDIDVEVAGQQVRLLAMVRSIRRITTRAGKAMAVVEFEDLAGSLEAVLFPGAFDQYGHLLVEDEPLLVSGRADERNDRLQVIVDSLAEIELTETIQHNTNKSRQIWIDLALNGDKRTTQDDLQAISLLLREFVGEDEVWVRIVTGKDQRVLRTSFRVDWCRDLERALVERPAVLGVGEQDHRTWNPANAPVALSA
jgi:DNA polymerase-3 subunit alpha